MADPIIRTEGLTKAFGEVKALNGVDLEVAEGMVFGLLGPNGAGKTTMVRILTTLLLPDGGSATVAGCDVVRGAEPLRFRIGLAGQSAAVDENLTGLENLELVGRLYHLGKAEARARGGQILERFGLSEAADRPTKTYSGGMRRRLDVAASLVGRPQVLFLDEPTTGLDPRSRIDVWEFIRELQADGTTLLLTTQYLEEADQLTDRIVVIDGGRVIAQGTSSDLKRQIGGEVLELHVSNRDETAAVAGILAGLGHGDHVVEPMTGLVRIQVGQDGTAVVFEAVRRLDGSSVRIEDIALHKPSLDDVFLSLTGHAAEEGGEQMPPTRRRRKRAEARS
jgi:ABC-2 type transport system ATP-binding protein